MENVPWSPVLQKLEKGFNTHFQIDSIESSGNTCPSRHLEMNIIFYFIFLGK